MKYHKNVITDNKFEVFDGILIQRYYNYIVFTFKEISSLVLKTIACHKFDIL